MALRRRQSPQQKFDQIKSDHLKKMGGKSSLFPPTSIPDNATKKALLALQSELRRLERTLHEREDKLAKWEEELQEREMVVRATELENEISDFEDWQDDDEDDCDIDTLIGGVGQGRIVGRVIRDFHHDAPKPQPTGDEIDWLNKLFLLKDKRRKK